MSNYAMLGLMEGLGKGITSTGEAVGKLSLQEAEDQRRMNLAKIQRDWANTDENTRYQRNLTDTKAQLADTREYAQKEAQIADLKAETVRSEDKADKWDVLGYSSQEKAKDRVAEHSNRMAEAEASAAAQERHRAPTEFEQKMDLIDGLKADGKITDDDVKTLLLGTKKHDLTTQESATLKMSALKQASQETIGKDPLKPPTPEQTQAINARAEEIYKSSIGDSTPTQKALAPGSIVTQDGKQYQIGADGKSAVPVSSQGKPAQTSKKAADTPQQAATAGPPSDPNWQQNLNTDNPVMEVINQGRNMTPEQMQAAEDQRREKVRRSFVRPNPYVNQGLME